MKVTLPEHSHCANCGDPVPVDQEYCSDACRQQKATAKKQSDRRMWLFYIIAIAAVVGVWLYTYVL